MPPCDPWSEPLDLASRLRVCRARWNLSIEEAAARCGLVKSTWATWEQGVKPRDATATLDRIARELKVDLQWLAFGTAVSAPDMDKWPYAQLALHLDDFLPDGAGEEWKIFPSSTRTGTTSEPADCPSRRSAATGSVATAGLRDALGHADERTALMLCLAAYAGLRRAEIAGLTRDHVLDDRDPPLLLIWGKGGRERLIPIGPVLAAALAIYGLPTAGPVFPGPKGCISPQSVGLIVSKHLRACGVDATCHNGRHWFASQLYKASGDLRVTQEMLGHQSPATTAQYAAWSPERAVTAIAALPAREPPEAA